MHFICIGFNRRKREPNCAALEVVSSRPEIQSRGKASRLLFTIKRIGQHSPSLMSQQIVSHGSAGIKLEPLKLSGNLLQYGNIKRRS